MRHFITPDLRACLVAVLGLLAACTAPKESARPEPAPQGAPAPQVTPCDAADLKECNERGRALLAQQPPELAAALAMFEHGCQGGNLDACLNLAMTYQYNKNDVIQGAEIMRETCESGYHFACVQYGNMYLFPGPLTDKPDYTRARAYFERACADMATLEPQPWVMHASAQAYGCTNLGLLYENGWGVERDIERAGALSIFSCMERSGGNACNQVGVFIKRGWIEAPGAQKTPLDYYVKACDLRDGPGCCNAAIALKEAEKPHEDARTHDDFLQLARALHTSCERFQP